MAEHGSGSDRREVRDEAIAVSATAAVTEGGAGKPARGWFRQLLAIAGPGVITGASDDDPSGIGTYVNAGAAHGFGLLWTSVLTLPLMAAVQFACAKVGMVSGMGLAGVLRKHYSRWVLYPAVVLLLVANTFNAGADLAAIAAAINLLLPIPIWVMIVPIALFILAFQIWGSYRLIANILKWLALSLLAYVGASILARPDWLLVVKATAIPTIEWNRDYLMMFVAILGTTISPYLFFWQANQEVEEEISMGRLTVRSRRGATRSELSFAAADVNIGMIFSNVVSYFVILAAAVTLHKPGRVGVVSAADAATALKPLAGDLAGLLFATGLIGCGLLAIPVLTGSSAYAVSEAFGWKHGLDRKLNRAPEFYAIIVGSTIIAIGLDYLGFNPMAALYWSAVINGLLAPPLLVIIMIVSNSKTVMGQRTNGAWTNVLGWLATVLMIAAAVGMFVV